MSYALSLADVRAYFGLRQHELAAWLGLSRVQLARIEAGTDPLPRHARPWARPWLHALSQALEPDPAPEPGLPVPTLPGPAVLQARLAECHYQAERLRQQLASQGTRARYLRRRLAAGPGLQAALPGPGPAAAEPTALALRRRWLARLLDAATDGLNPTHPLTGAPALALLEGRRRAWLHEASWLAGYLGGSGPA